MKQKTIFNLAIMFVMMFEIAIGQHKVQAVQKVSIETSQSYLCDVCTIGVPAQVHGKAYSLEGKIRRGDAVVVKLGYNNDLRTEFVGYVKAMKPNSPFEIVCECALSLTRRMITPKVFTKTTAPSIAQYVLSEVNKQLPSDRRLKLVTDLKGYQFDKFSIGRVNGFEVLDKLREETGLVIFARGSDIHLHPQYTYKPNGGDVTYDFAKNVRDTTNLEYQNAQDKLIKVQVIGKDGKGKRIIGEAGEDGGDTRTIQRPTISNQATLNDVAQQYRKRMSYDGYKGAIEGYLQPYCEVGYTAKVIDPDYAEREGKYYVEAVKVEFSSNGGKRAVTLGWKLS